MRICMILEGCYPYVRGGVSSWMQGYIESMPQHEFVLWTIGEKAELRGKFRYQLPPNVSEVHEVFLDDALRIRPTRRRRTKFTKEETAELAKLISCSDPKWEVLFDIYNVQKRDVLSFLMGEEFLEIILSLCTKQYPYIAFAELFHTIRSMLLPMLYLMGQKVPEADLYHAACTGYGGLLGALGSWRMKKPFVLTEHGIYTREREEEILRAKWVPSYFKQQWTDLFYMLSRCAYQRAASVTSLFPRASIIQQEIGCPPEKCTVIENGIRCERFLPVPPKEDDGMIDIGAVVRLAPIKDIITLIYAFFELRARVPNVRLHILGDSDDAEYKQECFRLVDQLKAKDILFVGNTDVSAYLKKLDFTVLSSISEGQPLAVLESLAARRPCVTTDVGCCRELLDGQSGDELGRAGICVPPMHPELLAKGMETLCVHPALRRQMGEVGQKRVLESYTNEKMIQKYLKNYKEVMDAWQESDLN
jgi:glycosyltransferase involved in cell wall biosynthesis